LGQKAFRLAAIRDEMRAEPSPLRGTLRHDAQHGRSDDIELV